MSVFSRAFQVSDHYRGSDRVRLTRPDLSHWKMCRPDSTRNIFQKLLTRPVDRVMTRQKPSFFKESVVALYQEFCYHRAWTDSVHSAIFRSSTRCFFLWLSFLFTFPSLSFLQVYRITRKKAYPGDDISTFEHITTRCAIEEGCAT